VLFVLSGASGSGKTTLCAALAARADLVVRDVDEAANADPAPTSLDRQWRAEATETRIREALEQQRAGVDFVLAGGVFGELLACPSATELDGIAGCLLDCEEAERVRRLRVRDPGRDDGSGELWPHVIWSAWLRLHRVDPQWLPRVLREPDPHGGRVAPWLEWERWAGWGAADARWSFERLSTSDEDVEATCAQLLEWIEGRRAARKAGTLPLAGRWWDPPTSG
jgi:hypothetical protein